MLKKPLRVELATVAGIPRIVDADGKPVCSFGNQARHRGTEWAWAAARQIVEAVNEYDAASLERISIAVRTFQQTLDRMGK